MELRRTRRQQQQKSGILSALGNLLAQMIEKKQKKDSQSLDVKGLLRYLVYGFFVTGPLSHYFYLFMDYWIPPEVPLAIVKRLLLDRLLFAPAFLLLFFLIINLLEGKDAAKMRSGFWPALQMNWRMWTPLQFININYVPQQRQEDQEFHVSSGREGEQITSLENVPETFEDGKKWPGSRES
ncbi:peroxisomal membrane protein 2 isoform X4 [Arvicola amphibius]|uniref:peroxisomal membrane protein 2 isoform X4 n=1 Tax=Arvicola amphibius TaxID=1047088 RepID=UPI0018E37BE5|nr:peroxisomal membrane protein 2 isoform X4 [Arvicola amphibius]